MNKLIGAATAALLLLAAESSALAASTPQQPPRMTSQQLVENFQAADFSTALQRPDLLMKMRAAEAYLDGVADAFHGTAWCSDGSVKRDEINSAVIFSLKKLGKDKLAGPAAGLVKESLSKLYPCRR